MSIAKELFREVTVKEMPIVMETLKKDWPKHFLLHQILTVFDEYKKAGSQWKNTLYLYGDYGAGVYLNKLYIELPTNKVNILHLYSPGSELEPVKRALESTQLVPWNKREKLTFAMVQSRFTEAIVGAFASNGLDCVISSDTMFWYPPDKKHNVLPVPDDVYLKFLDGSFAEAMDQNWPHKYPGSIHVHRENLEKNFGLGLFHKRDNRLVCSVLSNHTGGIFTLHTDPECRGRGYAKIVVQHMVQELRLRNRIPFCTVILGNVPSEKTFTKCGFESFVRSDYIFPK